MQGERTKGPPALVYLKILAQGLDGNGLCHYPVEVVRGHGGQRLVDGFLQNGVALHQRNADVDILGADLLGELEVTVGAGEVQDLHVGISSHGALCGGHIGADEVHHAGLQSHQHGGSVCSGGLNGCALDLGQALVVPDGSELSGAGAAGQISNGGGVGIGAVVLGDADDGGVEIGACEIHLLGTSGGHGLAGDNGIKLAGLDTGNQGIPVGLDDFQLPAVGLSDGLADHNVVAVGVGTGGIGDGNGTVGIVVLGPVVGSVGTFHGDGQNAVLDTRGDLGGTAAAAGGQTQDHDQGQDQGQKLLHFDYLFFLIFAGISLPAGNKNWTALLSGPWKFGKMRKSAYRMAIDSASQSYCDSPADVL